MVCVYLLFHMHLYIYIYSPLQFSEHVAPPDFVSTIQGPDLLVGVLPLQNQWGSTPPGMVFIIKSRSNFYLESTVNPPKSMKNHQNSSKPKIWDQNAPSDSVIGPDFIQILVRPFDSVT